MRRWLFPVFLVSVLAAATLATYAMINADRWSAQTADREEAEGRMEADRDIATGKLTIRWSGNGDSEYEGVYVALGRERFSAAVEVVGEEVAKSPRSKGYRERMWEEIALRHGPDAAAMLARDAGEAVNRKRAGVASPPTRPAPPIGQQLAPEPRRIYGRTRDDPVVVKSVDELVDQAVGLKGKWVRVTGMVDQVNSLASDTIGSVHMVKSRKQLVIFSFYKEAWKKDLVAVNDVIVVTGRLETATEVFTTLSAVELSKRTSAKSEPPIEIGAAELTKEFAVDPVTAHAKYRAKYLKVTGVVNMKAAKAAPGGVLGMDGVKDPKSAFNLRVVGSFDADQREATDAVSLGSTITMLGRMGNVGLSGHDIRLEYCRLAK